MEKLNRFLIAISSIFTGMLAGSLWITHTESWKIYLPIILLAITLKSCIKNQ